MSIGLNIQDPAEVSRVLWKRKLWILGAVAVSMGLAVVALKLITPVYLASTLVMVEPQKVPSEYVRTTVTSSLHDRLRTLEQQIETRPTMEQLIEELGLYREARDLLPMEKIVDKAREDLTVRVVRNQIVEISFVGTDPIAIAEAANRITELFIDQNLRLREMQAVNTTAFLDAELARTEEQLNEQERRVSEYRLRNSGSLPSQRSSNLSAISQLERRLEQNRGAKEDVELRILLLERQTPTESNFGAISTPVKTGRLESLELELQMLRSQYTDRHPDVIRLQTEIDGLRRKQALEAESEREIQAETLSEPPQTELSIEQQGLFREWERLERERELLMSDLTSYQRRLEQTPQTEQELVSLTRDYNNLERFYQSLLAKQVEAKMAEELERQQQSEQFRILEEAVPPIAPFYPNRTIVLAIGLLLGASVGVGTALAYESVYQTFRDEESLRRAFPGVSHVIAIPRITEADLLLGAGRSDVKERSA